MENGHIIRLDGLTKYYGEVRGIDNLTFDVAPGEIFGLLGPNGSGKTTTVRLLLDLIRPTSGAATVFGMHPRRDGIEIRRRIGYLPGDFITYNYLTGESVTSYFSSLRGVPRSRYTELCDRFELDPTRKIGDLSKGNRQKIGLVQAFMNDPDLLILDEPTSGLDPLLQHEFQQLLLEEKASGKTVLLSSHVLSEVEATADRVCVIRNGTSVAIDTVENMTALTSWEIEIDFASEIDAAAFGAIDGVSVAAASSDGMRLPAPGTPADAASNGDVAHAKRLRLQVGGAHAIDAVIKTASRHEVTRFESERSTLEDVVLTLYEGD